MIKVLAILDVMVSLPDRAGGSYTAFRYTLTENGRQVTGLVGRGCENNVHMALGREGLCHPNNVYYTQHDLPIRKWNRETVDFQYSGTNPDEIAKYIQRELNRTVKVEYVDPAPKA